MLQRIPLTEDECAVIEVGVVAIEKLCEQLVDIPTPTGLTPHELSIVRRNYVASCCSSFCCSDGGANLVNIFASVLKIFKQL